MDLSKLRKEHSITLREVSTVLGYKHPGGYHKIEQGKQKLRLDQVEKLSHFYKVNPSIFFKD